MAWRLEDSDLKKYPHFDSSISAAEATAFATDPTQVARHAFYPFIRYTQRWTKFADRGGRGKVKERPIRYAARRDAYVFAYYRHVLAERYEAELQKLNLTDSVLAYRRIRDADGKSGKCNIHFARDAFRKISELGDCCALALDISSFFEHLDHEQLKKVWRRLLGVSKLPNDHFQVFKAITQYAVVDKRDAYERFGHFGVKRMTKGGDEIKGFTTPRKEMPTQLGTGREFRQKIAGDGPQRSVIEKNYRPYGIPQGAPISDLLANIYLIDFDTIVERWARELGGVYYRYSDDILIVVRGDERVGHDLMNRVRALIGTFGKKLEIKKEKSAMYCFVRRGDVQTFRHLLGSQGKNGLEYLGFRYNGQRVYIRDATLSNLHRKIARVARREAEAFARRYPDKDATTLRTMFDYNELISRFGRVEDFREKQKEFSNWTFWTYARRSAEVFGRIGRSIVRQLRSYRISIRDRIDKELERAVARRDKRMMAAK